MNIYNEVNSENYQPLIKKVLSKAYAMTDTQKTRDITVVIKKKKKIRTINHQFRGKNETTDVLTFPSDAPDELGDVLIALFTAMKQANDHGHTLERELAFLTVHGFLHALGYDHDTKANETRMFDLQSRILDALKIFR